MALEYTLSIDSTLAPVEILKKMLTPEAANETGSIKTERGVSRFEIDEFTALALRELEASAVLRDELGISTFTSVLFRINKFEDLQVAKKRVLLAVLAMIHETTSDLALLFNGEILVLIRRNGILTLNENAGFWEDGLAEMITLPYQYQAFSPL